MPKTTTNSGVTDNDKRIVVADFHKVQVASGSSISCSNERVKRCTFYYGRF
jgi:hypothetical protein